MNKKANIIDILDAKNVLFGFAIVALVVLVVINSFNTGIQSNPNIDNGTKEAVANFNTNAPKGLDYGFLLLLVGFIAISTIFARLIPSSPAFYAWSIVFMIGVIFISVVISKVYVQIISTGGVFSTVASNLPILNFVMPRLVFYGLIYFAVVAIALYTKDN